MDVLLTWFATKKEIDRFQTVLPKGSRVMAPKPRSALSRYEVDYDDVAKLAPKADVMMGWVVPPGIWELAKKVKALIWLHAGCDELDFKMLKRRKIEVCNVRGANGTPVAEHAMALMLASAKRIINKHKAVLDAHWEPPGGVPEHKGVMMKGKTVAVIGLGEIGTAVAKRSKAFEMTVIAVRRHPKRGNEGCADEVYGPKDLHKVLKRADFTVLATPITKETRAFIGAKEIACMKPSSFLINVARGNLIQEMPLYNALKNWKIAGFASDVWWNYENAIPASYHFPTPSRTDLQRLPNVTCTGNQAASGVWALKDEIIQDYAVESLAALAKGKPMPRRIDLDLGY
ncbi:MAG: phosphoglycerate dehydrogenase [Rhodospirillales bacterium]|nr:phosphoglycerate dehydrogenase [Rhodospirillales bacterium]